MTNTKSLKSPLRNRADCSGRRVRLAAYFGPLLCILFFVSCQKPTTGPGGVPPKTFPPVGTVVPNITIRPQEESQWCWAASAQMVIEWNSKHAPQCAQLNSYENKYHINHFYGNCCSTNSLGLVVHDPGCNVGAFPNNSFHDAKVRFTETPDGVAVSPELIEEEIGERHRPVVFSWQWTTKCPQGIKCGHMMVIVGYTLDQDRLLLSVYDPDPVPEPAHQITGGSINHIFYDQFKAAPATYTHWKDFYAFADETTQ